MNQDVKSDELILKNVLERVDKAANHPDTSVIDEETLALFVAGQLDRDARREVLAYLDQNADARRTVSLLMQISDTPAIGTTKNSWSRRAVTFWVATAAALLIAATLLYLPGQSNHVAENRIGKEVAQLLHEGRYQDAEASLQDAAHKGIASDRLRTLHVQAVLESPDPVALTTQGRLTDLGYDIHGIAARGASAPAAERRYKKALHILDGISSDEAGAKLNRGYLLLQLALPQDAVQQFNLVLDQNAEDPLALLGLGLAHFVEQDFAAAEAAFRRCLKVSPDNDQAKMNLAMTLTELGELEQAVRMWQSVRLGSLPPEDREQVRNEIENLNQFIDQPSVNP